MDKDEGDNALNGQIRSNIKIGALVDIVLEKKIRPRGP